MNSNDKCLAVLFVCVAVTICVCVVCGTVYEVERFRTAAVKAVSR